MQFIGLLNSAEWPQLKTLNLFYNHLDDTHVAQLVKGKWAQLEVLNLFNNKTLTAHATRLLSKADCNWPMIKSVVLHDLTLDFNR